MLNSFGMRFTMSTFGESHGVGIGCVVDGVPAGLEIDEAFIQTELDRRRPGQNQYATSRKEPDAVEILSGVFEGKSTGTPIAMVIYNTNQKSKDYSNIKDLFRPGHADFTYFHKYGIRDYRGGGRSSARESAARVAAGALAKLMLNHLGIKVEAGVHSIGGIDGNIEDYDYARTSEIFALDPHLEAAQKEKILAIKNEHDSIGGIVKVRALGVPVGLGEPMYHKLDGVLADAMMGLNAVKAVEIGEGADVSKLKGSFNNDGMNQKGFTSNHAGGVLGGISTGETIEMCIHFKPTPSVFLEQETRNIQGESCNMSLKGRHDPCVAVRGAVVVESMMALVLADMLLLNMGRRIDHMERIYG